MKIVEDCVLSRAEVTRDQHASRRADAGPFMQVVLEQDARVAAEARRGPILHAHQGEGVVSLDPKWIGKV